MPRKSLFFALLSVAAALPSARPNDDKPPDLKGLIKKLESSLSSEVIAASKELEALGPEKGKEAIPALVTAFKNAKFTDAIKATGRALGKMGPAAKEAVPVMIERLKKAALPTERMAIIEGLGEFGPTAKEAAQVLTLIARNTLGEERKAAQTALQKIQARPKQ
jgi:HEAT repeat protein